LHPGKHKQFFTMTTLFHPLVIFCFENQTILFRMSANH
jgi:hypothetical protein